MYSELHKTVQIEWPMPVLQLIRKMGNIYTFYVFIIDLVLSALVELKYMLMYSLEKIRNI